MVLAITAPTKSRLSRRRSQSANRCPSRRSRWTRAHPNHRSDIELSARRLAEDDREVCQTFDCGDEAYEREVNCWIRTWIWGKSAAWRRRTIIAFPDGRDDQLFGYGSWKHLDQVSEAGTAARHIEIAWFGVHREFRGQRTNAGRGCAAVLYSTVENDARSDSDSNADIPLTLECHVDNHHGHCFWLRRGYRDLEQVDLTEPEKPPKRYQRMVR